MSIKTRVPIALISMALIFTGALPAHAKSPSIHQDFKFMSDFLKALNGAGVKCVYTKDEIQFMVRESGACTWRQHELPIAIFTNAAQAKKMIVEYIIPQGVYYLAEKNWMISTPDATTAKALSKLIKSKIN